MNSNQLNDCLSFNFQYLFLVLMFYYLFLYYSLEIENWPQARSQSAWILVVCSGLVVLQMTQHYAAAS